MNLIKRISPLLLIIPLTSCTSIGEKNTDMAYIYGFISIFSLALLVFYCLFNQKKTPWCLLLFAAVVVVNLGYFTLSISKNLEEALLANRISYMGSVFLPYALLMILIDLIKIKHPRWLSSILLVLCCVVFLITASPGYLDIYYKSVSIKTVNGVTILEKIYGPWHCLYLYYLLFYYISMLTLTIYVIFKKKATSIIQSIVLLISTTVNIGIWLLEQLVKIDFEILSVSYIITELFLLVLFYLMEMDLKEAPETNATPSSLQPDNTTKPNESSFSTELSSKNPEPIHVLNSENTPNNEEDSEVKEYLISQLPSLTAAEKKIYDLYLQQKTTREILSELCITENTLKFHNKNLYGKLGVSSRKQLYAIASKLPRS